MPANATQIKEKILVVDDERSIVRLVQINLERHGYRVTTAFDGREALEKIALEPPDMVVSDVMMPYMDGFELLRTLKKNQATRHIPVILLTAKAMDADVSTGWLSGADCYLTKPFNPHELVAFVQRILEYNEGEENGKILQL